MSTDISLDDSSDGSLPRPIIKVDTRPPKSRTASMRNRVHSLNEGSDKPSPMMGRRYSQSRVTFTPPPSAMGPVRFCLICPNPHDTRVCPAPYSFQQRIKILVVEQNRCPVCLRADDHGICRTEPCLYCLSENHHSALCQQRY